jgi:cardiolipin synthase
LPESLQSLLSVAAGFWPYLLALADLFVAGIASGHAILYKRDVRAAIGWSGLIWFVPFLGALFYLFLGINRIRRRAEQLERPEVEGEVPAPAPPAEIGTLVSLQKLGLGITDRALVRGNRVTPLLNGDEAYPAMLEAIGAAQRSILMCSYIFDHDRAGRRFLEALSDARGRGVEERVLIDSAGARYSRPRMTGALRERGVEVAEFLPARYPLRNPYMNLRNHRKVLIVDGEVAFTGGLNIREGCVLELDTGHATQDLHFRLEGPIVAQLFEAAALDWTFTTGEELTGDAWCIDSPIAGEVAARAVSDGPDEDFEAIRNVLLGALAAAHERVLIATPYFLPDQILLSALRVAVLRGVHIDIVLPRKGNLRFVEWAATAQLWQPLEAGCRVWLSPPPFDHTKLMIVDGAWTFLGSSNWDPRSLRLNFELNVECYCSELATELTRLLEGKIAASHRLEAADLAAHTLPVRLRNGIARLFSPYL